MTEAAIRDTIRAITLRHREEQDALDRRVVTARARWAEELADIRSQCRHRKRTLHYGDGLPSYYTCDTCSAEVPQPKES